MKLKKKIALFLTAAMTAGLLAGCGDTGNDNQDSQSTVENSGESQTSEADNASGEEAPAGRRHDRGDTGHGCGRNQSLRATGTHPGPGERRDMDTAQRSKYLSNLPAAT